MNKIKQRATICFFALMVAWSFSSIVIAGNNRDNSLDIDLNMEKAELSSILAAESTISFDGENILLLNGSNVTLTGGEGKGYTVEVAHNATAQIELKNCVILTQTADKSALFLNEGAKLNLSITGENRLQSTSKKAALAVTVTSELTIAEGEAGGSLYAQGGDNGAGIGGSYGDCGKVTIKSGTVNAIGGKNSAGIGGAYNGQTGEIEISGGTVYAEGGDNGAGIGGGLCSLDGSIKISGGEVCAVGGLNAAGIGEGFAAGQGELSIKITSAKVISQAGVNNGTAGGDIGKSGVSQGEDTAVYIGDSADLTLEGNGIIADNLSIGECTISGDGAGGYQGTYCTLTIIDGTSTNNGTAWSDYLLADTNNQTVKTGATVKLASIDKSGYRFDSWTLSIGSINRELTSDTFIMTTENTMVTGNYILQNAMVPTITKQPVGGTVRRGVTIELSFEAYSQDGGTLTYQWWKSTDALLYGKVSSINGATSTVYSPPTDELGTTYYYCYVKNTNNAAESSKSRHGITDIVAVTVVEDSYTLTVLASNGGSVTDVSGVYESGEKIQIDAESDEGYYFGNWDYEGGGKFEDFYSASTIFTMPASDTIVTAYFGEILEVEEPTIILQPQSVSVSQGAEVTLTIEAVSTDGGTVTYDWYRTTENVPIGGFWMSGGANATSLTVNTSTVGSNYYYVIVWNRKSSLSGISEVAYIRSEMAEVKVSAKEYPLTITAESGGRIVTGDNGNYVEGAVINLVAQPDDGYVFGGWTSSNGGSFANSESRETTFTMPAGETEVTANFTKIIDAAEPQINANPQGAVLNKGEQITLTVDAVSTDGGELSYQWYVNSSNTITGAQEISGAISSSYSPSTSELGSTYYYVIVTNTNLRVNGVSWAVAISDFAKITVSEETYMLTVTCQTGGSLKQTYSGKRLEGDIIELQAEAFSGYAFEKWESSGDGTFSNASSASTRFTMPAEDVTITAKFIEVESEPTTSDEPGPSASPSGNDEEVIHSPYISGFENETFRPGDAVTRAQLAMMLWNLDGSESTGSYSRQFSDVLKGSWYYEAIMNLAEMGVIDGYEDGKFRPDDHIKRAEVTALLIRYRANLMCISIEELNAKTSGVIAQTIANQSVNLLAQLFDNSFNDDDLDSHWAINYILQAQALGIIDGYEDGKFRPDNEMNRAEAVTVLNRLLSRQPIPEILDQYQMPFTDVSSDHWAWYDIMEAAVKHTEPKS